MGALTRRGCLAVAWLEVVRFGAATVRDGVDPPATPADVTLAVDSRASLGPISPLVYGTNTPSALTRLAGQITLSRLSGNTLSTYDWENNASNGGKHSGQVSDAQLVLDPAHNLPAAPVIADLELARQVDAHFIVTVPAMGWVAADTAGYVPVGTPIASRFVPSFARKPGAFADSPDLGDAAVYQDEFVHYVVTHSPQMAASGNIHFCIDNEPSLWAINHPRAHPAAPTYAEVIGKNIEYAAAIKDVFPAAFVQGGVLYGWDAFVGLQDAPDRHAPEYAGRIFLEVFLDAMRDAEQEQGRRLVDALDVHWYPEARGGGVRITSHDATPALVEARLQAARSLWDPTYVEDSWITENTQAPIVFLPWIHDIIDRHYPGTKLVISEYNYGGGSDISGAIAEADVLGQFGRGGVYASALWELDKADHTFVYAGMAMYRDFDGEGARFGDLAVATSTTDVAASSVYAALDSSVPDRLTIVALNKTHDAMLTDVDLRTGVEYGAARAFVLTAATPAPVAVGTVPVRHGAIRVQLPPMSVTTLELTP